MEKKNLSNLSEKELIELIEKGELFLKDCPIQTKEICLAAVRKNGLELHFVIDRSDKEICLEACKEFGDALQFLPRPLRSDEIEKAALINDGCAIRFFDNPSEELCLLAVKQTGKAIQYIKNPTKKVCEESCENKGLGLKYIKRQTKNICKIALKNSHYALEYCRVNIDEPDFKLVITQNKYLHLLCEKINNEWFFSTMINEKMSKEDILNMLREEFNPLEDAYDDPDYKKWLDVINKTA